MSSASRAARQRPARKLPVPWPILALIVLTLAAAGYTLLAPSAAAAEHPTPREAVTAAKVQPPERYASDPQVAAVYAEVARIADTVDGIYCYCDCSHHSGHYSLLTCFESDHGASCGTCLDQAHLAFQMKQAGASLDEIRAEIDRRFG